MPICPKNPTKKYSGHAVLLSRLDTRVLTHKILRSFDGDIEVYTVYPLLQTRISRIPP